MTKEELIRNTIQALQAELKTKDTNLATLTNTVRQLTKDKQSLQDEKQSLQTQLQKKTQQDDENNQQKQRLGQKLQAQEQIILEGRKGNQTQATEIERLKQQINSNITFYTTRAEEHKQQIAKQQKEAQADKHRLHNYDRDKQFTHTIYKVVGWIVLIIAVVAVITAASIFIYTQLPEGFGIAVRNFALAIIFIIIVFLGTILYIANDLLKS